MANASEPDLAGGITVEDLPDGGMVQGKIDGEDVILARSGSKYFAVGGACTHYGGPLVKGFIVGEEIRCPLHHAAFSLKTGEALRAPAFDAIPCWRTECSNGKVKVREKLAAPEAPARAAGSGAPESIVILGGGAAGFGAADGLRRAGYAGTVTLITADDSAPYDRPNLSKDYLAGKAPDEWLPLRPFEYYAERRIDLLRSTRVTQLDVRRKQLQLDSGRTIRFDRLLIATGAESARLAIPGAAEGQLLYLRSYADCRALIARVATARDVVIVGGGFIGLEAAASLRARGIGIHVVMRDREEPLERVIGAEIGRCIRRLHEEHGVVFHKSETVRRLEGRKVYLGSGATLDADFVLLGVGVRPALSLAEQAGLKTHDGIVVNEYLQTSAPGVFAAGDVARWPDPRSGDLIRVEHWVVAERQGQLAAKNLLGQRQRFDAVPYFWTQQYEISVRYVGHAQTWDEAEVSGDVAARDCKVSLKRASKTLAVITISRDRESLQAEAAMEAKEAAVT